MTGRNVLIAATGSANLLTLPQHVLALQKTGDADVRIVMTRSAAAILPPATMRLVCTEVFCDGVDDVEVGHVRLAAWADRVVVLPATANVLGQVAGGLAAGLLTSVLLAADGPVLFFPSMNRRMWTNPAVRRNVAQVRADGHIVMDPVEAESWEVPTQSIRTSVTLPPPETVAAVIREFLAPQRS